MKLSNGFIELIKKHEGFRASAYKDAVNLWTIGYGTLIDTIEEQYLLSKIISEDEGMKLVLKDSAKIEKVLNNINYENILNQNQFDALGSFAYNLGTKALLGSKLLRFVVNNPNDYINIEREFGKWVYADKKKLNGLVRRRKEEFALYAKK